LVSKKNTPTKTQNTNYLQTGVHAKENKCK